MDSPLHFLLHSIPLYKSPVTGVVVEFGVPPPIPGSPYESQQNFWSKADIQDSSKSTFSSSLAVYTSEARICW